MENLYNHLNQLKISKIWKTKKDLIILKYNDTIQDASRVILLFFFLKAKFIFF